MLKIGLLMSSSLSEFRLSTLKLVLEDKAFRIMFAVTDSSPKKSLKEKIRKNLKRGSFGYVLIMAFKSIFSEKIRYINTNEFCKSHAIDNIETSDPYSDKTLENIRKYKADLLLLIDGFGIIRDPLLKITPIGVLSYHHGDMRMYRGQPPAFWELYNNESEMGITVQILSAGLDRGIPVVEKRIEIKKNDSLKSLEKRAYKESEDMMYMALIRLSDPAFVPAKIESFGKVYTLPGLRQWIIFKMKMLWRRMK